MVREQMAAFPTKISVLVIIRFIRWQGPPLLKLQLEKLRMLYGLNKQMYAAISFLFLNSFKGINMFYVSWLEIIASYIIGYD